MTEEPQRLRVVPDEPDPQQFPHRAWACDHRDDDEPLCDACWHSSCPFGRTNARTRAEWDSRFDYTTTP